MTSDSPRKCATDGCDALVFGEQDQCQVCINERRIQVAAKRDRRRLKNKARHIGRNKRRRERFR